MLLVSERVEGCLEEIGVGSKVAISDQLLSFAVVFCNNQAAKNAADEQQLLLNPSVLAFPAVNVHLPYKQDILSLLTVTLQVASRQHVGSSFAQLRLHCHHCTRDII